jgi:hypothetical protein
VLAQDLGGAVADPVPVVAGQLRPVAPGDDESPAHLVDGRAGHRAHQSAGVGIAHVQRALAADQFAGDAHPLAQRLARAHGAEVVDHGHGETSGGAVIGGG